MTQTVLLGDICDVRDGTHDSPKPKDSGHPLVTSKHIKNHQIDFTTANLISDEDFEAVNKRSKVDKYDILISMIGTVGELALINYEPTFAIKNIGLIKTGDELLGKYLFYYLQSTKAKQYIEASLAGSTQKFIGLGQLRKFPIELPDLEIQKKIADILGMIDTKIELNRKMSGTLEQMGQALFRHHFINNPEAEKWEDGKFSDVAEVLTGKGSTKSQLSEAGEIPLYGANGIMGTSEHHLYDEPLVITGRVGTLGNVRAVTGKAWFSDNVLIMKSKVASFGFIYYLAQTFDYLSMNRGSTQPLVTQTDLKNRKIHIPDSQTLERFEQQFSNLFEQQQNNTQQTQTLTALRDTLLPRLISGKMKV